MVHEDVRDSRKDDVEEAHRGQPFGKVRAATGYLPPCARDANAFGDGSYFIRHDDPLEGRALPSVDEEVPPYSCCPTPYRWMLEGFFDDICAQENLQIPGRRNKEATSTWVMEDHRQRALLGHFWGKLQKGKSLIFYYCNRGNAVDNAISRLLVGVSRIADIGDPVYFGRRAERPGTFPVWSRRITNGLPREGVRIPYQEYTVLGKDLGGITCTPPNGLSLPASPARIPISRPARRDRSRREATDRTFHGRRPSPSAIGLVSLIDCYVVQLSQVFMLRVFPFGTNY
jgi:exodeoxyribonuclease V alpha subunit